MSLPLQWNWKSAQLDRNASCAGMQKVLAAALAKDPDNDLLQLRMIEAWLGAKQFADVIALGMRRPPGAAAAGFSAAEWDGALARALSAMGRHNEALLRLAAIPEGSSDADLRQLRIETLIVTGQIELAKAELELVRNQPNLRLAGTALDLALEQWGAAEILSLLDRRAKEDRPGETCEMRLACLLLLGRTSDAAAMVDLDHHISETMLAPPPDWEQARFIEALRTDTAQLEGFERDPAHYSTVGGQQSFCEPSNSPVAMNALVDQFRYAVERYWEALPADDPIRAGRPDNPDLDVWAVALDRSGYHRHHIHAGAWLSGVYYLASTQAGHDAGALRIGLPRYKSETMPWNIRSIVPKPGKLVLFPSFLRHDTLPHPADQPRVSISFDVVPSPVQAG